MQETEYYYPAEWETHQAIWLSWPPSQDEFRLQQDKVVEVMKDMILALVPHVKIRLIVQTSTEAESLKNIFKSWGCNLDQIELFIVPHDDIWIRDFGPIFLKSNNPDSTAPMKVASFEWSVWGYLEHIKHPQQYLDGNVSKLVAQQLSLPTLHTNIVSEGGDREFNGKGVMITCEAVELQRNPSHSKEQLEQIFKNIFNLKKVIWMKEGLMDDTQAFRGRLPGGYFAPPATGGHVDEFVRFVGENVVLLAEVIEEERHTPLGSITHARMQQNLEILQQSSDHNGNPFTIIRIPLPPLISHKVKPKEPLYEFLELLKFDDGTVLDNTSEIEMLTAASYCNFIVTNGVVLIPKYYTEGKSELFQKTDAAALQILQQVFPDRKVVQIATEKLNEEGGGMHCISQQQPLQQAIQ